MQAERSGSFMPRYAWRFQVDRRKSRHARRRSWASRPHLTRLSQPGPSSLPLTVYAIEQLGNEAIVICDGPSGEKIRAIVQAGFTAPVGARLDVTFDGAAAHLSIRTRGKCWPKRRPCDAGD